MFFLLKCFGVSNNKDAEKIELANYRASLFQHFVRWMYFATLPDFADLDLLEDFELWALGDTLEANHFKDSVMKEIYRIYAFKRDDTCRFLIDEVDWLWETAPTDSLLKKFFIDNLALHWIYMNSSNTNEWENFFEDHPGLSSFLLVALSGKCADRTGKPKVKPLKAYLESSNTTEEN
jgi:hypothetical protein